MINNLAYFLNMIYQIKLFLIFECDIFCRLFINFLGVKKGFFKRFRALKFLCSFPPL